MSEPPQQDPPDSVSKEDVNNLMNISKALLGKTKGRVSITAMALQETLRERQAIKKNCPLELFYLFFELAQV